MNLVIAWMTCLHHPLLRELQNAVLSEINPASVSILQPALAVESALHAAGEICCAQPTDVHVLQQNQ